MREVKIENGRITSTYLGEEHGCLTANLTIEGAGWGCGFGGYCLAHWQDCQKPNNGAGAIVALLKALDLDRWEQLSGTYVRVKTEGWGTEILAIGHIMKDQWFSFKDYFEAAKKLEVLKDDQT